MMFIGLFVLLVLLSFVVITGLSLFRANRRSDALSFEQQNLELYRQRLRLIKRKAAQDDQSQAQTDQLIDELGLELLGQRQ